MLRFVLYISAFVALLFAFFAVSLLTSFGRDLLNRTELTSASRDSSLIRRSSPGNISHRKPTTNGPLENEDFGNSFKLKRRDADTFARVANLSWVTDGIDEAESDTALALIDLGLENPAEAKQFIEARWFSDGINVDEAWGFTSLAYLSYEVPRIAAMTSSMPWLENGVDERESLAVSFLPDLADESHEFIETMISKSWFKDGINEDEAWAIEALGLISHHTGTGARFANMPFLDSIEPADSSALISLAYLAFEDRDTFETIMSHPEISDGITDDETTYLTLAPGASVMDSELVDALLNQSGFLTEIREIDLPISGRLQLTIIRTRPGAAGSMARLERSVRFMESYMGQPFPINIVLVLYTDTLHLGFGGYNSGASMVLDTSFDVEADRTSNAGRVLVHELAHYYWHHSSHLWIDEGAAEVVAYIYGEDTKALYIAELLAKVYVGQSFCGNIEDLRSLDQLTDTQLEECGMAAGFLFFLDLYHALGPDDFRGGLSELYLLGKDAKRPNDPRARGINEVRAALSSNPKARDEIIPKWYGAIP